METYANVDMEDYWNEYHTVRAKTLLESHSEEDSRSHDDDSDDTFLEAVLPDKLKEGDREISETELTNSRLYFTLTDRQKAQLIRRTQERNLTLRQKRLKIKTQKPDVWSVFSAVDNSSTGTRSRSATPDSLDSISPPRTPPDPSPQNWVDSSLSRSRASLDSGHHSLIMTPASSLSPTSPPCSSPQHLEPPISEAPTKKLGLKDGRRQLRRRYSPPDARSNYYYPPEENQENNRIYRPSSLDVLSDNNHRSDVNRIKKEATVRRQRSYAQDISKDVRNYYYYGNKGQYELSPKLFGDSEVPDIQGLHYKPIGSLHIPHCKTKERRGDVSDQTIFLQQETAKPAHNGIRRSHSIKHYPRDPFEPLSDREISPKNSTTSVDSNHSNHSDNSVKSRTSTDLGFRILGSDKQEDFPELVLEVGRSGQTKIDWLHENDLAKVRALSILELDIIFSEYNIQHSWRKRQKRKKSKEAEKAVFGVHLETLREKDKNIFSDSSFEESSVPQVLHKLITHLELRGLRDEGILRIPGNRGKTELLRKCLDDLFYDSFSQVDPVLRDASANEIAALIKLFLRELPQPLLTFPLSLAFYKAHKIPNLGERVLALTMLVLLLPRVHRDTLKEVLDLCAKVVAHERENKMGLYNVAMIIAPNIFLPSLQPKSKRHLRAEDKDHQLQSEMEYAKVTTQLVQVLIKYREVLWTVPNRLIAQVRHQYESSLKIANSRPMHKLLAKKNKELIHRPIINEVDYQNGVLRISAPQFSKINHPIKLDWKMTAKDILLRFIEEQSSVSMENSHRVTGRREQKTSAKLFSNSVSSSASLMRTLSQSLPSPGCPTHLDMTTCLLRGSVRHALDNHALHERGGNITEKRIDPSAYLIAVYQDNPNGEFLVKCHHPGGHIDLK